MFDIGMRAAQHGTLVMFLQWTQACKRLGQTAIDATQSQIFEVQNSDAMEHEWDRPFVCVY